MVVFLAPGAFLLATAPLAGDDPLRYQALVWVADVMMLALVWAGLRARGEGWRHLGLGRWSWGVRGVLRGLALSLIVFATAVAAFLVGAIVAGALLGVPEGADTTGYAYMRGNLPMLLVALPAVWVVSSFGEEVVYRGFLINRVAELSGHPWRWGVAVAVSAVAFGLAHFAWGPAGMVQTTFMGIALGMAYLRLGRRLWILVLAHAWMDTILFVQMYLG